MKRISVYLMVLFTILACQEESSLTYSETNFISEEITIIEVNIPIMDGSSEIAKNMNTIIESFVANAIYQNEVVNKAMKIEDAVAGFNQEYMAFSKDLTEPAQPWEAFVDGEVTLNSPDIISIAINAYLNTGGVHGNSVISFLNFNPATGETYSYGDLIDNMELVKPLFEKHFKKAVIEESGLVELPEDINFKLPETIGFSEDGIIAVYNQHELEDFSLKMLEFTIPFGEVSNYLSLDL